MNSALRPSLRVALGLGTLLAVPAATPPASPPPPLTAAQQIDRLLHRRLKPEPLPLDLPNPFVMSAKELKDSIIASSPAGADTADDAHEIARPLSNAEVLSDGISRLRFAGIIRLKDQIQVVINDQPRKEGDTLKVPWNNTQILIRVQRISSNDVILRYLDVEATVRF